MKWLITGGCGFIGTSLIKNILDKTPSTYIRILDNLSVGSRNDLASACDYTETTIPSVTSNAVELVVGDIRYFDIVDLCSKGIDCVVHLAANTGVHPSVLDPRNDMETNVLGLFNTLEASRHAGVKKFILASSNAAVGEANPPVHEELAPHPVSPYGSSKLSGEAYCSSYFRTFDLQTIALRFGNVYGPGSKNKASVVAKFIKQALDNETCEIYGDGSQTRDFIYIFDLVDAIIKAVESDIGGEIFQIATSRERTINEIVLAIKKELHKYNITMNIVNGEYRKGDVMRNFSDTNKAQKLLKWKAVTPLEEGITKTIEYFLNK